MPTPRFVFYLVMLVLALLASNPSQAQTQEKGINALLHPDRTKTSDFAGKTFQSSAALGGKQASVRTFNFGRAGDARPGGGAFRTRDFAGNKSFGTGAFATRADRAASQGFAGRDKGFGTKSVDVREAPQANQTLAVRGYEPANKLFTARGKRQDTLDEMRKDKNLSIEEVREILNKPNGRPGKPPVPLSQMGSSPQPTSVPQMNPAPTFR